jgi:hypothetical protein
MTTTISSTDIVVSIEPLFTTAERSALGGFLAGYSGLTRDAYALDLRMYTAWCQQHGLYLFQARRSDIECFGRDRSGMMMPATARCMSTSAGRLPPLTPCPDSGPASELSRAAGAIIAQNRRGRLVRRSSSAITDQPCRLPIKAATTTIAAFPRADPVQAELICAALRPASVGALAQVTAVERGWVERRSDRVVRVVDPPPRSDPATKHHPVGSIPTVDDREGGVDMPAAHPQPPSRDDPAAATKSASYPPRGLISEHPLDSAVRADARSAVQSNPAPQGSIGMVPVVDPLAAVCMPPKRDRWG